MPNRDGTGPNGQGSRTGRGTGNCGRNNSGNTTQENTPTEEDSSNTTFGKRDGSGRGLGRGAGNNGIGRRCCGR